MTRFIPVDRSQVEAAKLLLWIYEKDDQRRKWSWRRMRHVPDPWIKDRQDTGLLRKLANAKSSDRPTWEDYRESEGGW